MMMKRPSGLGRGLGALIPQKQNETSAQNAVYDPGPETGSAPEAVQVLDDGQRVYELPVEQVSPNTKQPRLIFDNEGLEDLVASIKEHGVLQPLIVRKQGENDYELIAGERRLRASRLAGLDTVPAIVREAGEQEKLELAIIENVQRSNLNPIEEARAYAQLKEEFGLTQDEVAKRVGKSRPQIANIIRLLDLEPEIQEALSHGKISQSNGRTLLGIPDTEERMKAFRQMISGKVTVRQTESKIPPSRKRPKTVDPNLLELEAKLRAYFGGRVAVKRKPDGNGEIKIEFNSDEDLQRILDRIQKNS
ncbi:ParB/RepB/Spo0J family partition protein [Candidatus Uhrbacteria bacterium]|nr:ParB/RepB/Spo0J family partition protein [Candidatus Uhrbacteria bacterium]